MLRINRKITDNCIENRTANAPARVTINGLKDRPVYYPDHPTVKWQEVLKGGISASSLSDSTLDIAIVGRGASARLCAACAQAWYCLFGSQAWPRHRVEGLAGREKRKYYCGRSSQDQTAPLTSSRYLWLRQRAILLHSYSSRPAFRSAVHQ